MKYKFRLWQFCGLLGVGSISITYDFYWWLNWCIGLSPAAAYLAIVFDIKNLRNTQ